MTYASATATVDRRTARPELSTALPVFRTPKRNVQSISSGKKNDLTGHFLKAYAPGVGREAFDEMFVASRARFIATAYAILRNREDAEDAVQNAFVLGCRHLWSFEGRSSLRTWFTRIVLNAALMIQRKRKLCATGTVRENGNSNEGRCVENIADAQDDPETAHAEQEVFDVINGILGKMKPKLRQPFTMTYFDELSSQEACVLLGVSATTFKARLARAKKKVVSQTQRAFRTPIYRKRNTLHASVQGARCASS